MRMFFKKTVSYFFFIWGKDNLARRRPLFIHEKRFIKHKVLKKDKKLRSRNTSEDESYERDTGRSTKDPGEML
jgi:hypothetical protein